MQKNNTPSLLIVILATLAFHCQQNQSGNEQLAEARPDTVVAVCIWDNISVRSLPDADARWITALSLGESVRSTQIVEVDSANDNREYVRVLLKDGTEGWALHDFVVPESEPAVFLSDTDIYQRPDLLTRTDKQFSKFDIVAIVEQQDDWVRVKGRRSEAKWLSDGWIKIGNLSKDEKDIAAAKFILDAIDEESPEKQVEALQKIAGSAELETSLFIPMIDDLIMELQYMDSDTPEKSSARE